MYTNNRILLQTNMFNLEKVEIMKKVFYKSLILAFSATMLSANVNAQFAGGTGTESDPYIIQTAEQLNEVRNYLVTSLPTQQKTVGYPLEVIRKV